MRGVDRQIAVGLPPASMRIAFFPGGRAGPLRWELPARIAVATSLVLILTGAARLLDARLSGLIATYPVFAAGCPVLAHHQQGLAAAQRILRGLVIGSFSFAGFFSW